jgi:Cys-rich protein (TIGR01571 family)
MWLILAIVRAILFAIICTTNYNNGVYGNNCYNGTWWIFWYFPNYLAWMIYFYYVYKLRADFRQAFQIPGTAAEDCLMSFCCACCSLAQMMRHVTPYERGNG